MFFVQYRFFQNGNYDETVFDLPAEDYWRRAPLVDGFESPPWCSRHVDDYQNETPNEEDEGGDEEESENEEKDEQDYSRFIDGDSD